MLFLRAHGLQQLPDFSIMLHGLTVPVAEEILQHLLLVLETQAQLLSYLALPRAQLAQQGCCKLLKKAKEGRDGETLLPSNCKLLKDKELFSLGVAKRMVSQQTQALPGTESCQLPKHWAQVQVPSSETGGQQALVWDHPLCTQTS